MISPELLAGLETTVAGEEIPVIATLADRVDLASWPEKPGKRGRSELVRALKGKSAATRRPVVEFLKGRGVGRIDPLWAINGLAFSAVPEVIHELAARPEIEEIRYDVTLQRAPVAPSAVAATAEDHVSLVQAPALWEAGFTGQGVIVAVVDSGVDLNHVDLAPRWRGGSNSWFNPVAATCNQLGANCSACDLNTTTPCDYLSVVDRVAHGTGVAAVAVGGDAGGTGIGVAPDAQWIAVKIFNSQDEAPASVIHQGFQWLLDPDGNPETDDAPDVVNNSWGFDAEAGVCDSFVREFQPDVQALKAAGIAVVFSAGNTGAAAATSVAPANYPESFAVGSVGTAISATTVSTFSARGPSACDGSIYPEVVAPGFAVRTADYTFGGVLPTSYVLLNGTSFSAPNVAGVMALLLSAFPGTTPEVLEASLIQSASDLGAPGPDNTYGYGLIDAVAAFNALGGTPQLSVFDPVPPENDFAVDFASVAPGQSETIVLTLTNVGSGLLSIQGVEASTAPFSVASDGCTNRVLGAGGSCSITASFAPVVHAQFTGALTITANDPLQTTTVALAGSGNRLPPAPQPKAPADGATGLTGTVDLEWLQLPDADGDVVTNLLYLATTPDFTDTMPVTAAFGGVGGHRILLAGGGLGLALIGMVGGVGRRGKRKRETVLLLIALLAAGVLASCGGGGGGSDRGVVGETRSFTATGLQPATTYYWQVVAEDGFGGRTEGPISRFTTQ